MIHVRGHTTSYPTELVFVSDKVFSYPTTSFRLRHNVSATKAKRMRVYCRVARRAELWLRARPCGIKNRSVAITNSCQDR